MKKLSALLLILLMLPVQIISQSQQNPQKQALVFTHVTVIDMTGAPPKSDMTVVITGNRITKVGKIGKVRVPQGAQVVDATDKYLIPSFWDMHVHLSETKTPFPLFIANGILGVRHMGGNFKQVLQWREDVKQGRLLAPRILTCGPVVDKEPEGEDVIRAINAAEGRQAVSVNKRQGADFIKVYDGVSRDAYFALADEAKRQHIPFAGHTPIAITSFEVSDAGQRSIEHLGNILRSSSTLESDVIIQRAAALLKPSGKPNDFTAIPARIAEHTKIELATFSEQKAKQLFAHFIRNETWQVPTLEVKLILSYVDDGTFFNDPRMRYVPASEREDWKLENNFFFKYRTPEFIRVRKLLFQKELELTSEMHRAGVKFMVGTDIPAAYAYTGFSLHDELALFVRAGFSPMEALQAATRNPAEYLGELESSGTVEEGKIANLVLLEANPLENIRNTQRINAVVMNGRYLAKEVLQKMLADVEANANKK